MYSWNGNIQNKKDWFLRIYKKVQHSKKKKYSIHIAHYENNNVSLGKETNGLYNHSGTTIAYNFIYLQILIFNFESNIMSGYGEQIRECTMVYQRGLASGV